MKALARPRITVVTPSYNQAPFLESCLRSIVGQNYSNLECIVIDGGSTDGSVQIIKNFEKDLAYWVSERDGGQYDALNKGFQRATGDILAWLNSDDMYTPWAFSVVASVFEALPAVNWISTLYQLSWDEEDLASSCIRVAGFDRWKILRRGLGVQQESTFWRRSLWEQAGARFDTTFRLAADLDLWARFWEHAELYGVNVPLGGVRLYDAQRHVVQRQQYMAETARIFNRYRRQSTSLTTEQLMKLHWLLPRQLRRLLTRVGVPYRRNRRIIYKRDGRWATS